MKKSKVLLFSAALTAAAVGASCLLNQTYIKTDASWTFNEKTDVVIDDIYNDDAKRVLSETGAVDSGFSYLDVDVSTKFGKADDAIYKFSSELQKKDGSIRFEIKADESVDLSGIKFCTRGNPTDRWSTLKAPIEETYNVDGDANVITKNEWATVDINIAATFSGDTYEDTTVEVTNEVAGFSLFNDKEGNTGHIQIRKVSYIDGSNNENILDNFNRSVADKPEGSWWWGSTGDLINRTITLNNGSYTYKAGVVLKKKCAVLELQGDFTGAEVATVAADGTVSEYVKWANLKDHKGIELPNNAEALTNVDIDLAKSGLTGEYAGISVKSTTEMVIRQFFASDCQEKDPEILYPNLDLAHGSWANDFNVEYTGKWSTEPYVAAPEALAKHGIDFVGARKNADGVTFDGKNLVLPAIPETEDYGNFFFSATNVSTKDYMVIVAKTVDGATMDSFRLINGSNPDAVWLNSANAGYGLKTMPTGDNYPYITEDGYVWYILDLNENPNLRKEKCNGEFSLYYGHKEGKILIDGIFFANKEEMPLATTENGAEGTVCDAYKYLGYAPKGSKYLEFTVTAEGGPANTKNFRFNEQDGKFCWIKDDKVIGLDGEPIKAVELKEGESFTFKIDLVKCGYKIEKPTHFHSHWFQVDGNSSGTLKVSKVKWSHPGTFEEVIKDEPKECVNNAVYNYLEGYDLAGKRAGDIFQLVINSEAENTGALTGIRVEFKTKSGNNKTLWFATWQANKLLDSNGKEFGIALKAGDNVFNIDLAKCGINPYDLTNIHVHGGDNYYIENPTTFTIKSAKFIKSGYDFPTMDTVIPEADYEKPTVTIALDKETYTAGDEVTLTITPNDNVSKVENIEVKTTCIFGSGDEATDVTITDNKFTATNAGTYTISVEVTDEAGNIHTEVKTVTVNEPVTPEPENPGDDNTEVPEIEDKPTDDDNNNGLSTGAIVGISIGSAAGLAAIVGAIIAIIKKIKK